MMTVSRGDKVAPARVVTQKLDGCACLVYEPDIDTLSADICFGCAQRLSINSPFKSRNAAVRRSAKKRYMQGRYVRGTVQWFNVAKGFCFIEPDDGSSAGCSLPACRLGI